MADRKLNEVLYEMIPNGRFMKVTAVDPISLVEVSIVASPNTPMAVLKLNARRKLEYVLNKREKTEKRDPWAGL
ncbi:hypothetical protein GH722_16475 [Alphaproteobacteria bacterium HT1-32]|jgi:L-cystine uptake protein TcyP (sodium:dicarboxylate symporter family)|nr:hypothetical protein [Alphaproteobacteria bacterium HT1-32]